MPGVVGNVMVVLDPFPLIPDFDGFVLLKLT